METPSGVAAKNPPPKQRSVKYPSNVILSCVDAALKIDKEYTDIVFTPKEAISKHLGLSGGAFDMLISTCCQYGLLELRKNEGYKPTTLLKKIKKPLPSENIQDFYKECFLSPPLYKKLITEFNGKSLPELSGLANILDRIYEVKGNAATTAAKVFLKNAAWLEMIDADNVLRLDGGITEVEEVSPDDEPGTPLNQPDTQPQPLKFIPPAPNPAPSQNYISNTGIKEIPVFLTGGREAKIYLPSDFTDDDIKKVRKVLNGYLPDE